MSDLYRFGLFVLDLKRRVLARDGVQVPLGPKGFDLLVYLVEHPNRVVTKQELIQAAWPDSIVEESNLTQQLSVLRKTLGEQGQESPLIVTVARQGYQFTANVTAPAPITARPTRITSWRSLVAVAAVLLAGVIGATMAWQRSAVIRLAVLPFENLTGDPAEEYLADGLTEEMITQLTRLRPEQLSVIARTSVMRYKHTSEQMDKIGRDLSVSYALESSLRQSANRLRVTVQLIRVRDQSHLWANDFDYAQADIFRIEDSVATAVAQEVRLRLTPAQRAQLTRAPPTSTTVVEDVMRGRDLLRRQIGKENWASAKRNFEYAIALDSGYAPAWAWLSATYRFGVDREYVPADEGYREARRTIARALALDPNLSEAWRQLGQLQRLVDWNWAEAEKSYQRSIDLDPSGAEALFGAASIDLALGRFNEAIALNRRAVELDPLNPQAPLFLGVDYYFAGRLDEATKTFESIPQNFRGRFTASYLVGVYLAQGRVADAARMVPEVPDSEFQLRDRALVFVRQGARRAADSALATLIGRYQTRDAYLIAQLYAFRGETDSALAWLDRAYARRDQGLPNVNVDPLLENARRDPRYAAFSRKMGLSSVSP
jgi:TolB-like protein/DNA-binding winged helix-turn-helix (wHTH) protein